MFQSKELKVSSSDIFLFFPKSLVVVCSLFDRENFQNICNKYIYFVKTTLNFSYNMENRNCSIEINEILIRNYHLSILDLKFPILDTSSQKSISKNISSYMILAAGEYYLLGSFSTFRISKNFSNLFLIRS